MADRFGPIRDWGAESSWLDHGFAKDVGGGADFHKVVTAVRHPHGTHSGQYKFVGSGFPPATANEYSALTGGSTLVEAAGTFLCQALDFTDQASAASETAKVVQGLPFAFVSSTKKVGLQGIVWEDSGGVSRLTFALVGTSSVFSTDFVLVTGRTYRYSVRWWSETTNSFAHVRIEDQDGQVGESIMSATTPNAVTVDRVYFAPTHGGSIQGSGNEIDWRYGFFEARHKDAFSDPTVDNDVYVAVYEATQIIGGTQRAQVVHAAREIIGLQYSYKRFGGCDSARIVLHAPSADRAPFDWNALRNSLYEAGSGNVWDDWTKDLSGGTADAATGSNIYRTAGRNPLLVATDSSTDSAAIYQETGQPLALLTQHRVVIVHRDDDSDNGAGCVVRIQNITQGLEWQISAPGWVATSGFTINDNEIEAAAGFARTFVEFSTLDPRLQVEDVYRLRIETKLGAGAEVVTFALGEVRLESKVESPLRDTLLSHRNLGEVTIWARHELGLSATHPLDSRPSQFRRVWSGFFTSIEEDRRKGLITIRGKGWADLMKNYLVTETVPFEAQSINQMVDSIVDQMVDATDGPFFTKSVGLGGDDPGDRIMTELDLVGAGLRSALADLTDLAASEMSWGCDADRQFFFGPLPLAYGDQDQTTDEERTIYTVDLERQSSRYKNKLAVAKLVNRMTVYGKIPVDDDDEPTGEPRPVVTVTADRSVERFGERRIQEVRDSIETVGALARFGQLVLQNDSHPKATAKVIFGPTRRFFEALERQQRVSRIMVRTGDRVGYQFGSDGLIFASGTAQGAAALFTSASSQWATFTPIRNVIIANPFQLHFVANMTTLASGIPVTPVSNGLAGGGAKFMRVDFEVVAGAPDKLRLTIYVSIVTGVWISAWDKTFADTTFTGTTRWSIHKVGGTAAFTVTVNGVNQTPDTSASFAAVDTPQAVWVLGALHSDTKSQFFEGIMDDFVLLERLHDFASDNPGVTRWTRSKGGGCIAYIPFDENAVPIYFRGQNSGDPELTDTGILTLSSSAPTFTATLVTLAGTGIRWNSGNRFGSYPVLTVEKFTRTLHSLTEGWETTLELGQPVPNTQGALEAFDAALSRIEERQQ